jgi:hypothetical protein
LLFLTFLLLSLFFFRYHLFSLLVFILENFHGLWFRLTKVTRVLLPSLAGEHLFELRVVGYGNFLDVVEQELQVFTSSVGSMCFIGGDDVPSIFPPIWITNLVKSAFSFALRPRTSAYHLYGFGMGKGVVVAENQNFSVSAKFQVEPSAIVSFRDKDSLYGVAVVLFVSHCFVVVVNGFERPTEFLAKRVQFVLELRIFISHEHDERVLIEVGCDLLYDLLFKYVRIKVNFGVELKVLSLLSSNEGQQVRELDDFVI